MRNTASKAKGSRTKAKKAALRDLKPSTADATRGGTTNSSRFDPYKNFKFRP
jgi:hypothetical protein